MSDKSFAARDVIMDVILGLAIGIQTFLIIDEITDGRLSRELSVKIAYWKKGIKDYIDRERKFAENIGPTLFDAITTVEDVADNRENREGD